MNKVGDIIFFNNRRVLLIESHSHRVKPVWNIDNALFTKGIAITIDSPSMSICIRLVSKIPAIERIRDNKKWHMILISSRSFMRFQKKYIPKNRWCTFEQE